MNNIFKIELANIQSFFRGIDTIDQSGVDTFEHLVRFFKYIYIYYLIIDIILTQQPDRTCFHAKIDVFGDKNGFHFRFLLRQPVNDGQYLMIGNPFRERVVHTR